MNGNRIHWIDMLKGTLLICVVLVHYREFFPSIILFQTLDFIYAWLVPAFFFISGYLFSIKRFPNFHGFFSWKSKTILLPYITLSLFCLIFDWNLYYAPLETLKDGLYRIFILGSSSPKGGPLWFVFTLYLLSIFYYPIYRYLGNKKHGQYALVVIFAILGWYFYINGNFKWWGINKMISSMPFFMLGSLSKETINNMIAGVKPSIIFLISIILLFFSYIAYFYLDGTMWWRRNEDNILSFYAPALLGIYGVVILFTIFNSINIVTKVLIVISRNGLILLGTHGYILIVQEVLSRDYVDMSSWTFFILRTVILVLLETFSICIINKYFYKFIGKEKKSFKESLSYK